VVFGALLVIAPVIEAVVLTWWLGAYALAFGVALLAGLQIAHLKDDSPRTVAPPGEVTNRRQVVTVADSCGRPGKCYPPLSLSIRAGRSKPASADETQGQGGPP
jgi:hypothetical protein